MDWLKLRKIPAPIKIKSALPPPQTQIPPPKTRNFMDMEVFLQKERRNSRRPSNWHRHFRPQNCGHEFYEHEDCSEKPSADLLGLQPGGQKFQIRPSKALGFSAFCVLSWSSIQGAPPRGRHLYFTFQVLQTIYSKLQKHPF